MDSTTKLTLMMVVLCCLPVAPAAAQHRHQPEIDSLQALLRGSQRMDGAARASTLIALGKVYMIQSDYLLADRCYTESLTIAEKENNDSLAALNYRNKSIIYFYHHSYSKAIEADLKSLQLSGKLRDTLMMAFGLKSIGDSYLQMGDSVKASAYYEQALPIFLARNELLGEAALYANQSILTHGDLRQSIALRMKAKAIWDKHPVDNILPTINLGNLGEAYLDLVRYGRWKELPASDTLPHDRLQLLALGEGYLRAAVRMAHANSDVEDSSYFTGVMAELEEQKGDFRKAYYDFRAYQNITDSIYSQENKNKLAEIENARAIERKNQEIATKELQIGNQHKKLWLLTSCIALLVVTGGLLYRLSLIRKRNNTELRQLNAKLDDANKVKARFFGILTHDLRSPVSRLIHFLQLQEMEPELLTAVEAGEQKKQLRTSAQVLLETMESVLLWSKGQMERFQPEFSQVAVGDLFREISRLFPASDGLAYSFQDEQGLTIRTDRHYLRSILYNLTANATRAVAGAADAAIEWRAWKEAGSVRLAITDNGPGIRDKVQLAALFEDTIAVGSSRGLGLHIVRDLARAIGCQIEAESLPARGMRFVITITDTAAASTRDYLT